MEKTHQRMCSLNPNGRDSPYHMGVSKNSGTPKWMVKIMENPIKMDDLGVPLFLATPIYLAALGGFRCEHRL